MATDNPDGPVQSMEERVLSALNLDGPEVAEEQQSEQQQQDAEQTAQAPESQDYTEDEASDERPEAAAGVVEVQADDGTVHKVPAALKDAFLRHQDYSRKTEDAAVLAKQAQDRIHYAEAREQFVSSVIEEVTQLKALESQLKSFDGVDIGAMYASDPGTALRLRDQRDELRRQIDGLKQAISVKARQADEMTQMHRAKQWEMAVEQAKRRLGPLSREDDVAMARQVQDMGFRPEELQGRFADPRFLQLVFKAAKWDSVMKGKDKAIATAQAAPPVLKPGAANHMPAEVKQKLAYRKELGKAKTSNDKANVIAKRLESMFR